MRKGQNQTDDSATRIWERLYLGSLADADGLAEGNPHGITAVISLCEACVASNRPGVRYVHIPVEDAEPVPAIEFRAVMAAIAQNIRRSNILLHCSEGVSRGPSFTASWMATVGYKTIDACLVEIKQLRPFIRPSKTLLNSLRRHLA